MSDAIANSLAFILNIMGFGVIAMVAIQGFTNRVPLISYRNIYLAGFVYFQLFSGATTIATQNFGQLQVDNPRNACTLFLYYAVTFLFLFLVSYHFIRIPSFFARWFKPRRALEASDWWMMLAAICMAIVALLSRFFGGMIPFASYFLGIAPIAPLAVAMAGWAWAGKRFNPLMGAATVMVLLFCVMLTMWGFFGRRPLVGACLAIVWAVYYRLSLKMTPKAIVIYLLPFLVGMVFFVGAFSMVRGALRYGASPDAVIRNALNTDFSSAFDEVARGTPDAGVTIWTMDAYPERHETRHLFSLKYMVYHPIPRALWESYLEKLMGEKPVPLALLVATLGDVEGVNKKGITIPPGVLGYAKAEGGAYALIIYALFFGQFTRFFDDVAAQNPGNPFLILAVGCTLGDLAGLARGDIAVFANFNFLGFLAAWILLLFVRFFIGRYQVPDFIPPRNYYNYA